MKRGLEEELIWLHTPAPRSSLPTTCLGTTPAVASSWEITKHFIKRYLTWQPSLPFHPPFLFQLGLQFHGGTNRKMREEPSCPWTHSSPVCCHGGGIVLTCVLLSLPGWPLACPCSNTPLGSTYLPRYHYLQPWLWLSPQWDIHTNPTTTVPQGWTSADASSRFLEQVGWASPCLGFPRQLKSFASCMTCGRGRIKGSFMPILFHHGNYAYIKTGLALRSSCN